MRKTEEGRRPQSKTGKKRMGLKVLKGKQKVCFHSKRQHGERLLS